MFDVTKNLKDAAYVVIGLGVIGYQQAQAQTKEARARLLDQRSKLDKQVDETRAQLNKIAKDVETRFEPVRETVEGRLDTLQERLPERAKELVGQARQAAQQAEANLRSRLNGAAA
jgi:hypothetical protein